MTKFLSDYEEDIDFTIDEGDLRVTAHFAANDVRDALAGMTLQGFMLGALRVDRDMAILMSSKDYVERIESLVSDWWIETEPARIADEIYAMSYRSESPQHVVRRSIPARYSRQSLPFIGEPT